MTGDDPFERYRGEFETALRATLAGPDLQLYEMVRYHMGWQDTAGNASVSRGKVLRPMLCLLTGEVVGADFRIAMPAAVAVELMHNFSLIHDDIQDGDEERHGRETVWKVWGQAQAINAGDLLWAVANRTLAGASAAGWQPATVARALDSLNYAAVRMIEGQYMDLAFEQQYDIGLEAYLDMTGRKTGALFGCALELGALAGGVSEEDSLRFRACGEKLGVAFQAQDDVLGVWGESAVTGKSRDNDIIRRKKTLLVVHAFESASPGDRRILQSTYAGKTADAPAVEDVRAIFDRAGSRTFATNKAETLYRDAFAELAGLPLDADRLAELARAASALVERTR